jgi:hypothetical protein
VFIALAVTGAADAAWRPRPAALAGRARRCVLVAVAFWVKYNAIVYALPVGWHSCSHPVQPRDAGAISCGRRGCTGRCRRRPRILCRHRRA